MSSQQSAVLTGLACLMFACAVPRVVSGAQLDACSLLTVAEVNAALGVSTVPPKSPAKICRWGESGGQPGRSPAVVVTIQDAQAFNFAKAPTTSKTLVKAPVSGVGDDAVFNTIGTVTVTLTVKKADNYFEVHVMVSPSRRRRLSRKHLHRRLYPDSSKDIEPTMLLPQLVHVYRLRTKKGRVVTDHRCPKYIAPEG